MGALLSRPLTLDDLNAALDPIKKDLVDLKEGLVDLKASLLAPEGDSAAKCVTLAVCTHPDVNTLTSCHGCILRRDDGIYFLSAAHSIIDLTYDSRYSIKWARHESGRVFLTDIEFDKIYIPKAYVLDGSNDVGMARLNIQPNEILPQRKEWRNFSVNDQDLVGTTLVGHGRVFLRGTVLSYGKENRLMIDTPSISGCSGCPLFNSAKKLAAFVHGGVKHRGGKVLHNNSTTDDQVTAYVYADIIDNVTLCFVNPDFHEKLRYAEAIEPQLASQPDSESAYEQHGKALHRFFPNERTLRGSMQNLIHQIWPPDNEQIESIALTVRDQMTLLSFKG